VWRWDQAEPFGASPADEDPDANTLAFDLPLRLPGQRYDAETGLHYNYFRDYSPHLGRYVQSDPLGLIAGPNTYAYVRASVLSYSDALGLLGCGPEGDWKEQFVPNNPFTFPFESCCDEHDRCYEDCKGPDQLGCDMQGCRCFADTCRRYAGPSFSQALCERTANEYCYRILYSDTAAEQYRRARSKCTSCAL